MELLWTDRQDDGEIGAVGRIEKAPSEHGEAEVVRKAIGVATEKAPLKDGEAEMVKDGSRNKKQKRERPMHGDDVMRAGRAWPLARLCGRGRQEKAARLFLRAKRLLFVRAPFGYASMRLTKSRSESGKY